MPGGCGAVGGRTPSPPAAAADGETACPRSGMLEDLRSAACGPAVMPRLRGPPLLPSAAMSRVAVDDSPRPADRDRLPRLPARYLPGLDTLRSLAVVSVILFHLGLP